MRARWEALPEWLRIETVLSLRVQAILRPHVVDGAPLDLAALREVYPAPSWPDDLAGRLAALRAGNDALTAAALDRDSGGVRVTQD